MIIKSLTLHNFGVYASTNTFSMGSDKPIVLIGGMNGHGKTTFLEAILIALYGSSSSAYRESKYNTYGQYLKSYVNVADGTLQTYIDLEFSLDADGNHAYRIRREWSGAKQRIAESISVSEDGAFNQFLTDNWGMFIEGILPSGLSSFFFFDGEKIADLAVEKTSAQMKESIKALLGISVLDSLESDLKRIANKTGKKLSSMVSESELNRLREERDLAVQELETLDAKILELEGHKARLSQELEKKRQTYSAKGGDIVSQRQELFQSRLIATTTASAIHEQLIEDAGSELPLSLTKELLRSILQKAKAAQEQKTLKATLVRLKSLLPDYASKNPNASEAASEFIAYVDSRTQASDEQPVISLSDSSLLTLQTLLDRRLEHTSNEIVERKAKFQELQEKITQLDNYLSVDIDEKAIAKLYKRIKEIEQAITAVDVELAKLNEERSSQNGKVISANAIFGRFVEDYLRNLELNDDNNRVLRYSHLAEKIVEEYRIRLQASKINVVAKTMTDCYKTLASKTSLIDHIEMDAVTLDLYYIDCEGNKVDKASLSAGEKQLMVVSLLWALARCSKRKLPVIIDTPLSRLDSEHRASLIMNYFPNASDQTIILSTDSEIDSHCYDMMKDNVGDEFTLIYSDVQKSTTIHRGYFTRG